MPQAVLYDDESPIEVERGAVGLDPELVIAPPENESPRFTRPRFSTTPN